MNRFSSSAASDSALINSPDGALLSLRQIAAMLSARRNLVAGVLFVTVFITALLLAILPRSWTSSTDVFVNYKEDDPVSGQPFSALLNNSYMQTQIDLLTSQRVAEQALAQLGWMQGADYADAIARQGEAQTRADLIKTFVRNTTVESSRESRILTISYKEKSPEAARDAANAIVAAYLHITRDLALSAARARSELYNFQIEKLRHEADSIQEQLTHYQQQASIVSASEDSDIDLRQLQALNALLADVRSQRQGAEAVVSQIKSLNRSGIPIANLPEISQTPTIRELKDKINDTERRLGEVSGQLGPNHPVMRGLAQERAVLQARLENESRAALDGIGLDMQRLRAREQELTIEIAKLESKVLERRVHRDRIAAYRRQLNNVEQVYNTALQKYDSILATTNTVQPNISIMRPAELPISPSAPRVLTSIVTSIIVGMTFGLCLALLLELLHRRVRCIDDLRLDSGLTILGYIGLESQPHE